MVLDIAPSDVYSVAFTLAIALFPLFEAFASLNFHLESYIFVLTSDLVQVAVEPL